jgi:hypothetical protein
MHGGYDPHIINFKTRLGKVLHLSGYGPHCAHILALVPVGPWTGWRREISCSAGDRSPVIKPHDQSIYCMKSRFIGCHTVRTIHLRQSM